MPDLDKQIAEIVGWKPRDTCDIDDQCGNHTIDICIKEKCQIFNDYKSWGETCPDMREGDEHVPPYSRDLNLITAAVEKLGIFWVLSYNSDGYLVSTRKGTDSPFCHHKRPESADKIASALCEAVLAAEKAKGGK